MRWFVYSTTQQKISKAINFVVKRTSCDDVIIARQKVAKHGMDGLATWEIKYSHIEIWTHDYLEL